MYCFYKQQQTTFFLDNKGLYACQLTCGYISRLFDVFVDFVALKYVKKKGVLSNGFRTVSKTHPQQPQQSSLHKQLPSLITQCATDWRNSTHTLFHRFPRFKHHRRRAHFAHQPHQQNISRSTPTTTRHVARPSCCRQRSAPSPSHRAGCMCGRTLTRAGKRAQNQKGVV